MKWADRLEFSELGQVKKYMKETPTLKHMTKLSVLLQHFISLLQISGFTIIITWAIQVDIYSIIIWIILSQYLLHHQLLSLAFDSL